MAELKKYNSFETLKLDEKPVRANLPMNPIFSEFEAFLKLLQNEYSNKKNTKADHGKQPNR